MLEWYRAGTGYETVMKDCAALLALTDVKGAALGRACLRSRGGASSG